MKICSKLALISIFFSVTLHAKPAPTFDDLGTFHFPISTKNPLAQQYFNQGMVLYYGFEWGEAYRSFRASTQIDPNCALCFWGEALALGAKINAPMNGHEYRDARVAIGKAQSLAKHSTSEERAYIQALSKRFAHLPKKIKPKTTAFSCHASASSTVDASTPAELKNYADAMALVSKQFPNDLNAKAIYVDAVFDAIEWHFWDAKGKINPLTPKLLTTLRSVLAKDPNHIGANHYYIHVVEQSAKPIDAIDSAKKLKSLVPGSEHLVHMPAHIYHLTGRYQESIEANLQAIAAVKKYSDTCKQQGFEPEINYLYLHNYDFLRSSAIMAGDQQQAMSAANELLQPPFASWLANEAALQWFIPIPYYVQVRFGLWNEILKQQKPAEKYQYALGMWHFAQGMAYAHNNQIDLADKQLASMNAIVNKGKNNENLQEKGIQLLRIARSVLHAEIAKMRKQYPVAINQLQIADKIQRDMGYHEPPDWYFPIKEGLGDVYLQMGQPKQALVMYQQVLKQYPNSVWAQKGIETVLKQQVN